MNALWRNQQSQNFDYRVYEVAFDRGPEFHSDGQEFL